MPLLKSIRKNNEAMTSYLKRKGEISSKISGMEMFIKRLERDIEVEFENLEKLKNEKIYAKNNRTNRLV